LTPVVVMGPSVMGAPVDATALSAFWVLRVTFPVKLTPPTNVLKLIGVLFVKILLPSCNVAVEVKFTVPTGVIPPIVPPSLIVPPPESNVNVTGGVMEEAPSIVLPNCKAGFTTPEVKNEAGPGFDTSALPMTLMVLNRVPVNPTVLLKVVVPAPELTMKFPKLAMLGKIVPPKKILPPTLAVLIVTFVPIVGTISVVFPVIFTELADTLGVRPLSPTNWTAGEVTLV